MRVLVLGAGGMLGRDLIAEAPAPPAVELIPRSRQVLDITDIRALERAVNETRPAWIVNAAAYTDVDRAERERELAYRVNGLAVGELGRIAREAQAQVVHFSTDYVFDGSGLVPYSEEAPCHPANAYGASKLAGEQALIASGCPALTIRTQWLFGLAGRSFPRTMLERARAREPTRAVGDQRGRPTYTKDVAAATWQLMHLGVTGLVHLANDGEATWFELAREIFAHAGQTELLSRCTSSEYGSAARRPSDSRLSTARSVAVLGRPLPPLRAALDRFFMEYDASAGEQ